MGIQWPDLRSVLAGIPWAVVGAVATRLYMPERATRDLDIAVLKNDAERARASLRAAGFRELGRLAIGGSSWASGQSEVDVIELTEVWAATALKEASINLDPQGLPVLPLPFLVLMKLEASRVQDIADVSRMLGRASDSDIELVRRSVREYAPILVEDLESLITLGKLEMDQA